MLMLLGVELEIGLFAKKSNRFWSNLETDLFSAICPE